MEVMKIGLNVIKNLKS